MSGQESFQARLQRIGATDDVGPPKFVSVDVVPETRPEVLDPGRIVRRKMLGYPLAMVLGFIGGYIALYVAYVHSGPIIGEGESAMFGDFDNFVIGATLAPFIGMLFTAIAGYAQLQYLFVAAVVARFALNATPTIVFVCEDMLLIAPPWWIFDAATYLGTGGF